MEAIPHMWLGSSIAVALVKAGDYSSNSTPRLRTSKCCGCKKKKKKKKRERERERGRVLLNLWWPAKSQCPQPIPISKTHTSEEKEAAFEVGKKD